MIYSRDQSYRPVSGLAPGTDGDMETLAYLVTQYPGTNTRIRDVSFLPNWFKLAFRNHLKPVLFFYPSTVSATHLLEQ